MIKFILASSSPRRRQILEWAELEFDTLVEPTDEQFPGELIPREAAVYVAQQKAKAVASSPRYLREYDNTPILAADTMVVCENRIIGKPRDEKDAHRMLRILSGKKHEVITGVSILHRSREVVFADATEVWFHELTDEQIDFYVRQYQPFDKAGAYAIQEWIGVIGIKSITGDFYNVMGLPISRVYRELAAIGS